VPSKRAIRCRLGLFLDWGSSMLVADLLGVLEQSGRASGCAKSA
jgi:hypothetical protein